VPQSVNNGFLLIGKRCQEPKNGFLASMRPESV
jgi:hypothetical protein